MGERLNLQPQPGLEPLRAQVSHRLSEVRNSLRAAQFRDLFDSLQQRVMTDAFEAAGAHEGTIWLADEPQEYLEPAWNSGPHSSDIVGRFKQPLGEGLISMAYATEQSFVENEVQKNAQQSKLLDSRLQVHTQALIAVPLHLLGSCQGVVSCVRLQTRGAAAEGSFSAPGLARVEAATALVARLIEHRVLRCLLGLDV